MGHTVLLLLNVIHLLENCWKLMNCCLYTSRKILVVKMLKSVIKSVINFIFRTFWVIGMVITLGFRNPQKSGLKMKIY